MRLQFTTFIVILLAAATAAAQPTTTTTTPMPAIGRGVQKTPPASKNGVLVIFDAADKNYVAQARGSTTQVFAMSSSKVGAVIDSGVLAQSFKDFMAKMGPVFSSSNAPIPGGYAIEEIELHLNITAEGSFGIIASGTVGTEGGITVVLRRPTAAK